MRIVSRAVSAALPLVALCAAMAQTGPTRAPLPLRAPVQDKNFYVLSLIERTGAVTRAVAADAALAEIAKAKRAALAEAPAACKLELACYADRERFSDAEIAAVGESLQRLYRSDAGVRQLADGALRASGAYYRYESLASGALLERAWSDAAHGINGMIDVYGLGKAPRYPAIDSISYDVKLPAYGHLVHSMVEVMNEDADKMTLFFSPSLRFALGLLELNHRDEAGRLEPMETGENRAAMARAKTLAWSKYAYSMIIVPGAGGDRESWGLSAAGRLRLTLAVRRYREGKAPFLFVSGGYVHPVQTVHCEALEMKKALMAEFGIPENAILIDPHARHTTTNLRNAVREIFRYGFPLDKPALITTDTEQSGAILSAAFEKRCANELGYQPVVKLARISPFDVSCLPNLDSLQFDAIDPLDP